MEKLPIDIIPFLGFFYSQKITQPLFASNHFFTTIGENDICFHIFSMTFIKDITLPCKKLRSDCLILVG